MKIPPVKIYFSEKDKEEISVKIKGCLSTGQLTLGKYGREFEEKFASYLGRDYAITVNSGTSALEISLRILGIKDKKVLVPTNTFFATIGAVLHAGGKPKFVDLDPNTFSSDVKGLEEKITPETRGVIVVHVAGIITPQMNEIQKLCKDNGLFLLEDAAHAHGSRLDGKMAGSFGDAASFSFYPTKVMTSGEGGMIVTNSKSFSEQAMMYRDQGKISLNQNLHDKLGHNWRMSEPNAIIGLAQFARLDEFIGERRRIARIYDEGIKSIPRVNSLSISTECKSNYYKYIALLDEDVDRKKLKSTLREKYDIGLAGEVYELPCHLQPIFKGKYKKGDFPKAEYACAHHICLPLYVTMKDEEANYVLENLKKVLGEI